MGFAISQVMSGTYTGRSVEDVDEAVLSYAEIKALASGDPRIMEWSTLQAEVKKLELQESEYRTQHFDLEDKALKQYPREIADNERLIPLIQEDIRTMEAHPAKVGEDFCGIEIQRTVFDSRTDAGKAILSICSHMENSGPLRIGAFRGFSLSVRFNAFTQNYYAVIDGKTSREVTLGDDPVGNITRISNEIDRLPEILEDCRENIKMRTADIAAAKEELQRPFAKQEELTEKRRRFQELTVELGLDSKDEEQEMEIDADELDDDEYVGELVKTSADRSR